MEHNLIFKNIAYKVTGCMCCSPLNCKIDLEDPENPTLEEVFCDSCGEIFDFKEIS
jgi:hypothetical protein